MLNNTSQSLEDLQKKLGTNFMDKSFLELALVHRSALNENPEIKSSNERLEFLGDSVLSVLVSTELYLRFPAYPEGKLTTIRSLLVKTKTLAQIAKQIGLGEFLLMSHGEERSGGRLNASLLADVFEAVIGAIYLDQGLAEVKKILQTFLFPLIPEVEQKEELLDYKSLLQETIQEKSKTSPQYKVTSQTGPDHDKTFVIGAYVNNVLLASGQGKSKQEGEQQAAKLALEKEHKIK